MIALEHIAPEDWTAVERVRQVLQSLVIDTGGRSIGLRFGATTVTWPGAVATSNATVINHGLNKVPVIALGICGQLSNGTGQSAFTALELATFTSTQVAFRATAYNHSPAAAVNATLHWLVVG